MVDMTSPEDIQLEELRRRLGEIKKTQLNQAKHQLVSLGRLDPGAMAYTTKGANEQETNAYASGASGLLSQKAQYERELPFREASLTGYYKGSPTASYLGSMLPLMMSGSLSKDYFGKGWDSSKLRTDAELDLQSPEYLASQKYGFANPYEMNMSITNPDWYNKQQYNRVSPETKTQIDALNASIAQDEAKLRNDNSEALDMKIRQRLEENRRRRDELLRTAGA